MRFVLARKIGKRLSAIESRRSLKRLRERTRGESPSHSRPWIKGGSKWLFSRFSTNDSRDSSPGLTPRRRAPFFSSSPRVYRRELAEQEEEKEVSVTSRCEHESSKGYLIRRNRKGVGSLSSRKHISRFPVSSSSLRLSASDVEDVEEREREGNSRSEARGLLSRSRRLLSQSLCVPDGDWRIRSTGSKLSATVASGESVCVSAL